MFVRRKLNASGTTSVQIVEKRQGRSVLVQTVGCARADEDVRKLEMRAERVLDELRPQLAIDFGGTPLESALIDVMRSAVVRAVGPELVLGKIFDSIGFSQLSEELFRDIVLARLVYPTSKLKTVDYLLRHRGKEIGEDQIYRFLDRLASEYKDRVEQIAYAYSKKILGALTLVFYDMTTLYFEAEDEDDLRRIGYSKDGKFQHPQIMLGLLVAEDGYPVSYDIFEGNTSEGKTLLPILEKARRKFGLSNPTVIADSALLSKENTALLSSKGYKFIIGARLKAECDSLKRQVLSAAAGLQDGQSIVIERPDGLRLIVGYSVKRAKKDASNREKGITRLQSKIKTGRLTKNSINNRGYNKFLTLKGETLVSLDSNAIEKDRAWDGLKGYLTNSELPADTVISNYQQLWKIERAFRISKTDLRIRPIYHRKKNRIEAHICVAFVAYTVFKELERLLVQFAIPMSPGRALELLQTVYEFEFFLPDSKKMHRQFAQLSEEQTMLLKLAPLG